MLHRSSGRRLRSDEGSALVAAILAMLLLGVFALSVSVLADLESRLGQNQKAAQQAVALAETGLEHGRNMVRDAATALSFDAFIATATTRRLGVPDAGISLAPGRYWVRVDNDCAAPAGFAGSPAFVPVVVQDDPGGGCSDTVDANETVVLTAWSEVTDGANRIIGRARLRAHYTIGNPWKHSCYDQDGGMCIEDAVGGCNNNPCIDPSDPNHPNGPAVGDLPIPSDIRCGTSGSGSYPAIPATDIPADVQASGAITSSAPCVIYPYYQWAVKQAAPNRTWCPAIQAGGYGNNSTDPCSSTPGTLAWDPANTTCSTTPQRCHGMVFFGPGNSPTSLATGADIDIGGTGGTEAGCMGTQNDSSSRSCYDSVAPDSSVVVYVMGKIGITNNTEVNGTVVVHGNGAGGGGANKDFGLTGTNRVTTRPCNTPVGGTPLAGTASPYCGYPLAILAYNPNEAAPTTAAGQTIQLDLSNSTSLVSGLIYSGGTADFSPLTVDGGLIAWDVNVTNTASRITYNPTYGNAAPPPAFTMPPDGSGVRVFPPTWVHCTYYASQTAAPTPCS
jgi:Tfp pilus assembly protein PilX